MQPRLPNTTVKAMSSVSCLLHAPVGGDSHESLGTLGDYSPVPQLAIIGYHWSGSFLLAQTLLEVICSCLIQAS